MQITKQLYGKTKDSESVSLFTLTNTNGMTAEITNYGGILVKLLVPDKNGAFTDVALGFDRLDDYFGTHPYFGAIIGRHANRIENSEFELNGKIYNLYVNDGKNHLHGGLKGFDKVVWHAEIIAVDGGEALELTYRSVDGEENYPGNLDVKVTYTLSNDNELKIAYEAESDRDTVVNLTNHAYFNLSGHGWGNISKHYMQIHADKFTAINQECVPNGEIRDVQGTPMDFRTPVEIGAVISKSYEQIGFGNGFDHNWVLKNEGRYEKIAEVYEPESGRVMEVYTNKPGVQFYSGNFLDGSVTGKEGAQYIQRGGLCLETQFFPNAMKHKHFPSPILKAGQKYQYATGYKFLSKA